MIIKVLGGGYANCKKLAKYAQEAVEKSGADAKIEKVTDMKEIMKYGVMSTPALVIDEKVVVSGKVLNKSKLKEIL